ncbi:MAG: hypothetical protein HWN51_04810, partial [Desulfobacterales bacterium]|nr:hypothetical protein [Desulfobacterales bacterium]
GDIIVRGVNIPERLPVGAAGEQIYTDGQDLGWDDPYGYMDEIGDIPVMGAGGIEDLSPGAAGTYIEGQGANTKPVYSNPLAFLTNQGDLVIKGAAVAERLPAGAVGTVLKGKGVGVKPAYELLYSLLTTEGDIIIRGAAGAERLAYPDAHQVLTASDVANKPYWYKPVLKHNGLYSADFTIDTSEAKVISGVGFQPSLIIFLVIDDTTANLNFCVGYSIDAPTIVNRCFFFGHTDPYIGAQPTACMIRRDASNKIEGSVTAYGVDGFEFTVTETGTCGGRVRGLCIG